MKKFATVAVSALLGATMYASAGSAAPLTITLNPSASSPVLSATNGPFNTNNATIGDNAVVQFNNVGQFTETGLFTITRFGLGLNTAASGVTTNYNIYGTFTVSGAGFPAGTVTSLHFDLFGDPNADTDFSGIAPGGATVDDFALGSGDLIGTGTAGVSSLGATPILTLAAITTFNPAAGQGGFFVAPSPFKVNFDIAATASSTATSSNCGGGLPCTITIEAGGGNLNFLAVPEPATLGMLSIGLLGLGAAVRRRRQV